ncbi:MAG TPA: hypothetical protein DCS07_15865, partial [Bdellovibrionales bacterium]|nr:hypothetical protein [Bdellovibrionales bacterium]
MNPEVIKLFGEKNSKSEGSPALTHEIDSLWKMSETLVEARQKLELPLRQMLSRSAQAEKELVETRTTVAQSRENYERSTEQVRVLKAQLEKQHHENLTLTHKNSTLEQRSQHLERDREKLMTCLNSERKRAMDSAAQLRTLTTTLENKEQEFKQVSQALQQYQSHWSRLVENDRKLREIIRQQQSMMRTRIEEQKILAAAERSGLESRIEQLAREKEILEKQVAMSAKELQTEHAALKTTSEALQNYQVQWNTILNTDRQLRMRITKLEQELQQQKTLV